MKLSHWVQLFLFILVSMWQTAVDILGCTITLKPQTHQPGACTTEQVQHTQDIFSLAGFTEPNIGRPDNQYYEAGYQPAQSTHFPAMSTFM